MSSGKEKHSKKDGQRRTKRKRMPPKLAESLGEKLDQKTLPCFPFSLAEHNAQPLLRSMCPPSSSSSIKNSSFLILIQKRSMSRVMIQKKMFLQILLCLGPFAPTSQKPRSSYVAYLVFQLLTHERTLTDEVALSLFRLLVDF